MKGPYDIDLRPLNDEEKNKIKSLFYRKSKPNFDFEDIAKKIAGKQNYAYCRDKGDLPYKFNYRMSQGVPGAPVTAQLINIFGEDWKHAVTEVYTGNAARHKTIDDIINEVWNVLYSFSSKDKVAEWGKRFLQLDDRLAKSFSEIRLPRQYASLSLKAVRKILPFLRMGMIYSHAVMFANIPSIVGDEVWNDEDQRSFIKEHVGQLFEDEHSKNPLMFKTIDYCIKDFLINNFNLRPGAADKLYHPSMIDEYPDAKQNKDGIYQLGSPKTNAVRNPMAMRSLHEIRKVVNQLLREHDIDNTTEVHVEYSRELNDSNRRIAIGRYQRELEEKHKKYAACIKDFTSVHLN